MKENTRIVLTTLIWATAITLILLGLFTCISISSILPKWTIEIAMDNNTLEAVKSVNYTAINNEKSCTQVNIPPVNCNWSNFHFRNISTEGYGDIDGIWYTPEVQGK